MSRRCAVLALLRRPELALELRLDLEGGSPEQRQDGSLGGEGFGNGTADDTSGPDNGAVFAGEGEGHVRVCFRVWMLWIEVEP